MSLTGCVGALCPASEVVLQQLVCPCGTGSGHQPHRGLMKKHLQEKTHIRATVTAIIKYFWVFDIENDVGAEKHHFIISHHTHWGYIK